MESIVPIYKQTHVPLNNNSFYLLDKETSYVNYVNYVNYMYMYGRGGWVCSTDTISLAGYENNILHVYCRQLLRISSSLIHVQEPTSKAAFH